MEDWIGTLLVIAMVPGLILLISVVVFAAIHMKGGWDDAPAKTTAIELIDRPGSRDRDA
jgi:hypothetical protein